MTGFALTLVLGAAFAHATWNFLAKRASGGAAFTWLLSFLAAVIYFPFALIFFYLERPQLGLIELAFMSGSAVFHVGYFLMLQRGYRQGDLSLVYPLARGTGPTLSTVAAILFLGERPTGLALFGALLVVVGIFILTGGPQQLRSGQSREAFIFGLLTGVVIAGYTLWDTYSVSRLHIPPLMFDYGSNLVRIILLSPFVYHRLAEVRFEWQTHRLEALGVASLGPLAYILVLIALTFTPVSYIAPAREVSVLIGVILGTGLLKEGETRRRLAAAHLIILGVIGLALS